MNILGQIMLISIRIILTLSLFFGIATFWWASFHWLFPIKNTDIFLFTGLAILTVLGRTIYNWIAENAHFIQIIFLIFIFWASAWAIYLHIQGTQ